MTVYPRARDNHQEYVPEIESSFIGSDHSDWTQASTVIH
jgi:hypothetical protein